MAARAPPPRSHRCNGCRGVPTIEGDDMDYLNQLLFGYYPYVCLSVFLLGSNLFHAGILLLFVGHLFGLLSPPAVYHALGLTSSAKQILSMVAGGIFGAMCLVGMTILVHRRLTDPRVRANSTRMDIFILLLLYVQLILGLLTIAFSMAHLDGANMVLMAGWAQHILTFRGGAAELLAGVGWIYKVHIFVGLTMFLVFPFSRLVHIWSAPVWYMGRRGYQIVRQR